MTQIVTAPVCVGECNLTHLRESQRAITDHIPLTPLFMPTLPFWHRQDFQVLIALGQWETE